ncbi:FKBP-type peptidyl-prolyl cis-trans isomerase [Actinoplanes palleronii]|uniref:FKBP-type peptidyl-prolyl cis-trans isomerase n=1 Tax=Actinoplanes palleronii TaxID=113570 RepID=UPI001EF39039|nr:FKBP-type peptidyl-prolyl cis-trans isomerase [Actinoplanes palleronii]
MTDRVTARQRPALSSKAEKRAAAKAAKRRAAAAAKRRQTLTVAGAAAAVIAVLAIVVVLAVRGGDDEASTPTAAGGTSASAAAEATTEAPAAAFPPVPAGADPALSKKPVATAGKGTVTKLVVTPLIMGKGAAVQAGQTATVNYVGVKYADGKEFDSSWKRSQTFDFAVGGGQVIKGWDQGLVGVTVGSRVQLDIPADLAYGDNPSNGVGGTLRFIVDVLAAK